MEYELKLHAHISVQIVPITYLYARANSGSVHYALHTYMLERSSLKTAVLELIVAVFTMHYIPICLEGLVSKQQSLS